MTVRLKPLIINILVPLLTGGFSAVLTRNSMDTFEKIIKPPFSPPGWLFPAVWTILFILMGISSYLVASSDADKKEKRRALAVYAVQLFFNFFWSIIFFGKGNYLFAFIWLIILWALIIVNSLLFGKISKPAGILLIPYLLWVTFAGYLNLAIYLLN